MILKPVVFTREKLWFQGRDGEVQTDGMWNPLIFNKKFIQEKIEEKLQFKGLEEIT